VAQAGASGADGTVGSTVFLSYSGKDRVLAEQVRYILTADGHTVWMAPHSIPPGASYAARIIEGINQASTVFLLATRNSNASLQVEREIERAVGKKKTLIALRADRYDAYGAIEYFTSSVQWVDLTEADSAVWADALRSAARNPENLPPPPSRAGIVGLTTNNLLLAGGVLACAAALPVRLYGDSLPSWTPAALLIGGVAMLLAAWMRASGGSGTHRFASLRLGDIVMIAALAAAGAAAWSWMLLTPLAAILVVGLLYLGLRLNAKHKAGEFLSRRGVTLGVVAALLLVGATAWAEVQLYNALKPTRVTLVLLPEDECPASGTCDDVPRELYASVRDILSNVFNDTGVAVYPTGAVTDQRYERVLRRASTEERARGQTLLESMARYDVFDTVLTLQVNFQPAACGGGQAVDFAVDLSDWHSGDFPTRAFWQMRRQLDWRQFEATIALNDEGDSPLLRVATLSMVARMLLAAREHPEQFGGERAYDLVVSQLLTNFRNAASVAALPSGPASDAARQAMQAADAPGADRAARLTALERLVDAYAQQLERRRNDCATEFDTLVARVAPQSETVVETAEALPPPVPMEEAAPAVPSDGGGR
jgi:hypothetical protein